MGLEIGDRIGVILHAENDTIYIYGYGEYKGESVPSVQAKGIIASILRDSNIENPQILLDTGETIWGCECWWGPEEKVKVQLKNYKNVVTVSLSEERTKK